MNALLEQATQIREQQAQAAEANREQMRREYVSILARPEPLPSDAERLSQLMAELDLAPERVGQDTEIIRKYRRLAGLHAEREQRHKRAVELREEWHRIRKECEERTNEAEKAARRAGNEARVSGEAAFEAGRLRRARPLLFHGGDGFPELLVDSPVDAPATMDANAPAESTRPARKKAVDA